MCTTHVCTVVSGQGGIASGRPLRPSQHTTNAGARVSSRCGRGQSRGLVEGHRRFTTPADHEATHRQSLGMLTPVEFELRPATTSAQDQASGPRETQGRPKPLRNPGEIHVRGVCRPPYRLWAEVMDRVLLGTARSVSIDTPAVVVERWLAEGYACQLSLLDRCRSTAPFATPTPTHKQELLRVIAGGVGPAGS